MAGFSSKLLVAFSIALALAGPAAAGPWIEPGDAQLRRDVELLAAYGIVKGPLTTWPISWAQVSAGIAARGQKTYPDRVALALARVQARMQAAQDRGVGAELQTAATNEAALVRGFDAVAREDVENAVSLDKLWSSTYLKATVGWRKDQTDDPLHFDDSYLAQVLGNWVFYGGTLPQWWGGGWDGGLLVSTNARPFARVGLQRLNPKPFDTKWLSWLGHWNIFLSGGRLENDRNDIRHPVLIEARLSLSPVEGLDIDFNRVLQLCGKGRKCEPAKAFFRPNKADNTDDPQSGAGNQLGGIGLRYGRAIGALNYATFLEAIGEDEAGGFPTKWSADLGVTLGGYWEMHNLGWNLRFEAGDTEADHLFGLKINSRNPTDTAPNVTFNHSLFTDGFTFKDRTIGHPLDTDSRLKTTELAFLDGKGRSWWLRYRRALLDARNIPQSQQGNRLSNNFERINIGETGVGLPFHAGTLPGDFRLEFRIMDNQPDTPDRDHFKAEVESSVRISF